MTQERVKWGPTPEAYDEGLPDDHWIVLAARVKHRDPRLHWPEESMVYLESHGARNEE